MPPLIMPSCVGNGSGLTEEHRLFSQLTALQTPVPASEVTAFHSMREGMF